MHSGVTLRGPLEKAPPGSGCSVIFGRNLTTALPGSVQGLHLIVSDIEAARADLLLRGIAISEPFDDTSSIFHHANGGDCRASGSCCRHAARSCGRKRDSCWPQCGRFSPGRAQLMYDTSRSAATASPCSIGLLRPRKFGRTRASIGGGSAPLLTQVVTRFFSLCTRRAHAAF